MRSGARPGGGSGTDLIAVTDSKAWRGRSFCASKEGSSGFRSGFLLASTPGVKVIGRVSSPSAGSPELPKWAKGSGPALIAGSCWVMPEPVLEEALWLPSLKMRKVWLHLLQRTFTPLSVTLSSGILKRV